MIDEEDPAAGMARRNAQMPGHKRQRVLNARGVPERALQVAARPPIPVRARIEWEHDGPEMMDVLADAWVNRRGLEPIVLLQLGDVRCGWVWVPASDVQRRAGADTPT